MYRSYYILIISLFCFLPVNSQDTLRFEKDNHILYGIVLDKDTIFLSTIDEAYIFPYHRFNSKWELRRYRRLIRNVKKAYPFAKLAKEKFDEITAHFESLDSERARKAYVKVVEKEIKDEYEDKLKNLTITQGRILIKLIDREIGETSYVLLKELRGSFSAFFWQTIARLFGSNLKNEFDAKGEDKLINEIVIMIESGLL